MTQLWVLIGLILSAVSVSIIGATFSITGLGDLFSGAKLAVWIMASALEFSKFVLAAYLHQSWKHLALIFRSYLLISVVILSAITSTGIFGFLSNAYQSAASTLELETTRLEGYQREQLKIEQEMKRINNAIDDIPNSRITKKLQFRAENAPLITKLMKESQDLSKSISEANLVIVEVKQKVGPLVYLSRAFKTDIDSVVKYLIFVLVSVFDPLAICLVIGISEALITRKKLQSEAKPVSPEVPSEIIADQGAQPIPLRKVESDKIISVNLDLPEVSSLSPESTETITMNYGDNGERFGQRTG